MSKVEEIEHAVEQLPVDEFVELAGWIDQRRQRLEIFPAAVRDHSAFLSGYAPQDEGLYGDAASG